MTVRSRDRAVILYKQKAGLSRISQSMVFMGIFSFIAVYVREQTEDAL
jgi:hypothetical protein